MGKMKNLIGRYWLALLAACCFTPLAHAEPAASQALTPHTPQLWLSPGFYAYHFQRHLDLNDNAAGLGVEYRYSNDSALAAGIYHNSNWRTSHYLGYYWQPLAIGRLRLGAVIGALNGYPGTRNGGWFPAALPVVSVEYGRLGMNLYLVPTYKDVVHGSIAIQLKLRMY